MGDFYEEFDISHVVRLTHGTKKGLYLGYGAIAKFGEALDDLKPSCLGFVTSPSAYKKCGLWDTIASELEKRGIPYLHYDKIMTNPTVEALTEAVELLVRSTIRTS